MASNALSIGPLLGYTLIASVPISLMHFGGHKFSLFGIYVHEIVLIIVAFYCLSTIVLKTKRINFIWLDWITIVFVYLALVPVSQSLDSLFIAGRDYRHLFLVPLIVYLSLHLLFDNVQQLSRAFLFFIPSLVIGNFGLLIDFLRTGIRLKGHLPLITLGLLCSWSVVILFLVRNRSSNIIYKFVVYGTALLMLLFMGVSCSRAVFGGFGICCVLSYFIFRKRIYQKLFIASLVAFIMLFYLSVIVISEDSLKGTTILSEDYKAMRASVDRVISIEYYKDDIKDRMRLWKKAFYVGLENPVFGSGASSYRNVGLSTPHNIYISIFLTSGCLGTAAFIVLIITGYSTVFSLADVEHYGELSRFFFIAFTVLLFVGATNDFSGGRYLLFFILLSGASTAKKLLMRNR